MELVINNSVVANNMVANNQSNNASYVSVKTESGAAKVAWKRFGTNFSKPVSVKEALEEAGANFNVSKQPLVKMPEWAVKAILRGEPITGLKLTANDIIENKCATVRDDNNQSLGIVGTDYGVVQNTTAFDFISAIKGESGIEPIIETAGVLGNGNRIFVSAKYGTDYSLGTNDDVTNYVLFTNTFDGSGAVTCLFTPVRVICQNTLNMALKSCKNKITFKHTKNVGERIQMIKKFVKEQKEFRENFIASMMGLKDQKITASYIAEFAAKVFLDEEKNKEELKQLASNGYKVDLVDEISTRTKNQVAALRDSIESGIGQQNDKGTKLWLFNGLTTFLHNDTKYKSAEEEFVSMTEGTAAKRAQKGFEILAA